jgi:SAM-dependent methyltransferase
MPNCRACDGTELELLFDLGPLPLAGGFLNKEDFASEQKYPLPISICKDCGLLQTTYVIPPDTLFERYLFSSSTVQYLVNHFANYARWLKERYNPNFVIEFGCNDGILLQPLNQMGIRTCGIDISRNITEMARSKGLNAITGYFDEAMADSICREAGSADIVTGSNAFPHNDDPGNILKASKALLRPDGHLILEMMYAGSLLEKTQWDSMYHEHLSYFCLTTLEVLLKRYGFHAVHAEIVPMHAGSLRVVCALGSEYPDNTVHEMLRKEAADGLTNVLTWYKFRDATLRQIHVVSEVIGNLSNNNTIWAYGAAGRATMWLNVCKMDYLECIVDESPLRAGKYMPGVHTPIVFPHALQYNNPDVIFVTAWNYFEQIRQKEQHWFSGIWALPVPELRFV